MPDRFRGRNVVVTGASRGIGAALAERLAAEGANVAIVARTVDAHEHLAGSLTETLARCRRYGARALAIAADLADADSRAAIIPRALELFDGRIDVLVNNAAAAIYQPTVEFPLKRRRISFEVNVHAPADLAQAVIPGMAARGEGWIVNVSSASARYELGRPKELRKPPPFIGVYGASKAALNRMTAAFAAELLGSGIRVNTIEPRAAVMSEGAEALVGGTLSSDLIESMEAMVEGALVLCDCPADWTGGVHVSPDLLDTLGPHGDDARRQQALPRRATAGAGAGLAAANRHQREPGREQEQSGGLGHPVAHGVTPSIQRSKVVAGGVTTLRAGPAGGSGRRRRR